jgi:hypothetical protein
MFEFEHHQEIRLKKGVMTVNDKVLLTIFDTPIEQTVEVGWTPSCVEASRAFV